MKSYKKERLNSVIREELSKLIIKELEFNGAMVTLTDVEVDNNLEKSTVWMSVIPSDKSKEVFKLLAGNQGHLQRLLMKRLKIRRVPRIHFSIDRGLEKAATIEKHLLKDDND